MQSAKKALRPLMTGIGGVLCAASVLVSLAVLLAFFTQRSDVLDSSLSSRRMATVGIALFLAAIAVFALEARKARRIKRASVAIALLCAAGGAVLVWSAFDYAHPAKGHRAQLAESPPKGGSGWKPRHGSGEAKSRAHGKKGDSNKGVGPANPESAGESLPAEAEAERSTAPPSSGCSCYAPEPHYAPPPAPEYESSPPEEAWQEEEGEDWEEEESWEEEEGEGWEEESWEEEEW